MIRFPSSAHAISMLALLISLGGAGYSATGGVFLLGKANTATTQTGLTASIGEAVLKISNPSTVAGAAGLRIATVATRPPLVVTSDVKVAKLNADLLDGIDSAGLTRHQSIPFNLAVNEKGPVFTIVPGRPVILVGVGANALISQVTLFRVKNLQVSWLGVNADGSLAKGHTHTGENPRGSVVLALDDFDGVTLEMETDETMRVVNDSGFARTGSLTLFY